MKKILEFNEKKHDENDKIFVVGMTTCAPNRYCCAGKTDDTSESTLWMYASTMFDCCNVHFVEAETQEEAVGYYAEKFKFPTYLW